MTISVGCDNPLIMFPAVGLDNPGFETALAAGDWVATGSAARSTAQAKRGTASCLFNPLAATGYIEQTQTIAAIPSWKNTGSFEPWFVYFWARNDSKTATPSLSVKVEMRDVADAMVASQFTAQTFVLGTDIITDTTWRLYRAGPFTPTSYTGVTKLYVKIGLLSACTAVLYIDNVELCHALDLADFTPGNSGAHFVHPYEPDKTIPREYSDVPNGLSDGVKFNNGYYQGSMKVTSFDETTRANWKQFIDYCGGAQCLFSLWANRQDFTRDYFATMALPDRQYRCERIPGSGLYDASLVLEESL